jgi:hypothetical protein
MIIKTKNPKGLVVNLGEKVPVTWERETKKYVYNVKRIFPENEGWYVSNRNFEDKMDKEELEIY